MKKIFNILGYCLVLLFLGFVVFYTMKGNLLYSPLKEALSINDIEVHISEEYKTCIELNSKDLCSYKMIVKEEESKLSLYVFYSTNFLPEQEDQIKKEIQEINEALTSDRIIKNNISKIRYRALKDDKLIFSKTYHVINMSVEKLMPKVLLALGCFFAALVFFIKRLLANRVRNQYLGGSDITDYSVGELKVYLESHKKDDYAFYRLGVLLYKEDNYEEAKLFFEKAILINPYRSEYLKDYGNVLVKLEDYKMALKIHKKRWNCFTYFSDINLLFMTAFLYDKLGKKRKYRKYLKQTLRICKRKKYRKDPSVQRMIRKVQILIDRF